MSTEDSVKAVRAAYDYLVKVLLASGTPTSKLSDFRVEELTLDEASKNYKVTLSYEVAGDFSFDKKRELKDFDVTAEGVVLSMRIRPLQLQMETLEKVFQYAHTRNRDGIILDTVVLLLLFIGKYDPKYISKFEPTHEYTEKDFELLNKIIRPFKKIYVTPQIIAEVSNHSLKAINNEKLHHYLAMVANFLNNKDKVTEAHVRFEDWGDKSISRLCSFGFVDLSMYELSKQKMIPILTDELPLYQHSKSQIPIIKLSVIKYSGVFA